MKVMSFVWFLLFSFSLSLFAALPAWADPFGSGVNAFEIEFVPIGDPGNVPDDPPNTAGAVPYRYRIGKYEISESMIDNANALGGLGITKDTRGPDKPATSISWFEAARFVNWLNTSTGHTPAYKFDDGPNGSGDFQLWQPTDPGYDANNLFRNRRAFYFLPSIDEWHKAAYYDPNSGAYFDYPTGSDLVPDGIDFVGDTEFDAAFFDGAANDGPNDINNVGLLSPFGTAGQGGNIAEWEETSFDGSNTLPGEQRRSPGGAWVSHPNLFAAWNTGIGTSPQFQSDRLGLRIARVVPEPNTAILIMIGLKVYLVSRRNFKTAIGD